ncbi:MAG: DUF1579 family protein [Acidobacteria bacterium]|nr:DUF1579 family protein [Acidobacteriota bacterium]
MSTRSLALVILVCGFTAVLIAQAPPTPPQPGPEHKKLAYFVGKWTLETETKANEFVPAGKGTGTETYTLGPGGFYVERRSEIGKVKAFGIMAYDSHAKAYTYSYGNNAGGVGTASGSVNGNTWTWTVEDKLFGKAVKGRLTVTTSSPTHYTQKYEMVDAKGIYTTISEVKVTKDQR